MPGYEYKEKYARKKKERIWGRRVVDSNAALEFPPHNELTKRENGLSCHGWLSTEYSQFGSNRLCPPYSAESVSKTILYL